MSKQHYTFGDGDLAAARLTLLAQVFGPTSRRLLEGVRARRTASGPPGKAGAADTERGLRALDLGCGAGFTTELLHGTLGASATWGVDASERLLDRAKARLGHPFAFAVHDVTAAPFPVPAADVVYARHLLAHIRDPSRVLVACASAARAGAHLVLEETAGLDSTDPVFAEYYASVRAMQAHYGQDTLVGTKLAAIAEGTPWVVETFDLLETPLDAPSMATLHAMNVRTWKSDPFAASAFDPVRIAAMTDALDEVAAGRRAAPPVTCTLGQAVLVLGAGAG